MTYKREKLKQSIQGSSKLVISKAREALEPFAEYVLDVHYNGVDKVWES